MKTKLDYLIAAFVTSLLVPLIFFTVAFAFEVVLWELSQNNSIPRLLIIAPASLLIQCLFGRHLANQFKLPEDFLLRLAPLIAPAVLNLLFFTLYHLIAGPPDLGHLIFEFANPFVMTAIYCAYCAGFMTAGEKKKRSRKRARGSWIIFATLAICLLGYVGATFWGGRHIIINEGYYAFSNDPSTNMKYGRWMNGYRPFKSPSALARPASRPTLSLAEKFPRLDGDRALLPLYGAVIEAIYTGLDEVAALEYADFDYPPQPYLRLIEGDADIVFAAEPPDYVAMKAAEAGLGIKRTPIALTALVFMVNSDNPVNGLSLKEVGNIYAGKIKNWSKVGGADKKIMAFTSHSSSVEQAMSRLVRQGRPDAVEWIMQSRSHEGFSYRFSAVYRNEIGDLGYDFLGCAEHEQFYLTESRKYLSVDGIQPSKQNIESGAYPLIVTIEALCLDPPSAETAALLGWLTGPEGQSLIGKSGFVPLLSAAGPALSGRWSK